MQTRRWAIFVSGQGSNLGALIDLRPGDIHLVVSSNPQAPALLRARRAGIATLVLPKKIDWSQVEQNLNERGISHIFLCGFMKVIPIDFLQKWNKPILNIHPSLLPAYPGLRSIERAYNDNAPLGVTVHRVEAVVDGGAIVHQKQVFSAEELRGKSLDEVEFYMHLAEYDLVKKSFLEASCWT